MSQEPGHIIVVGNEKGGCGKSTTAMHLIVALLRLGKSVASVDLDFRQATLTRYLRNRQAHAARHGLDLPMPEHVVFQHREGIAANILEERMQWFDDTLKKLGSSHEVIVMDTPGSNTPISQIGHSYAHTIVTPINDSFVDLDVLAQVDSETMKVTGPSHYTDIILKIMDKKAQRGSRPFDWIVMRNRLSSLDAHNKREMEAILRDVSGRFGFRVFPGFGERVIYRELFLKGMTMMDLRETSSGESLQMSHVAARQEVRGLVETILKP